MRIGLLGSVMGLMIGVAAAQQQDTNFSSGPQYLNTGSAMFAQPISTPSVSLSGSASAVPLQAAASNATDIPSAVESNEAEAVPVTVDSPPVNFAPIYYGTQKVIQIGDPRTGALTVMFLKPQSEAAEALHAVTETATNLSDGSLDLGAGPFVTPRVLQEEGFGVSLPQAAAYEKEHARHADRLYTNADIDQLRNKG